MDSAILDRLGKDEEISEETDQASTFQDEILYWILKIKEFVTDEYHPVSAFQTKPTPKVHINLPKLHIQPDTHSNGLRFGTVIVTQYTTILN